MKLPLVAFAIAIALLVAPAAPALAAASVTIDATVVNQTYSFPVDPPALITVAWSGLQVNIDSTTNAPATDNLALSFRDSAANEVLILFFKTSGSIVLQAPALGVTTDVVLGDWSQLAGLTIKYRQDKLQIYDDAGNLLYELANINAPSLADIWAHTPDGTTQAFTAGSITLSTEPDYSAMYDPSAITEAVAAVMPLLVVVAVFGVVIKILDRMVGIVGKLGR
ncbi:hypothetical protein APE_0728 [Aeropyrum pernix ovoid virus 1]|uniref:Uncharacterized protein n=2 Tax=root TaxID=1 RepID=Q9YE42_AERPE|nr:hypothetical protein [Aeropyrum pernix]YP_009177662.1 hypothetical protein ASQ65_gp11 [Aeropyrum pernix ovoid virus 1]BAA79704.1 hypothetical protein APE_0728 [Aeropyrum pernix ovoid virus 1] [Aeropyrum pernix K1]CCD22152.1 TPA: hypothetical protein [Aeropyrum pernix ovoid virus 1]